MSNTLLAMRTALRLTYTDAVVITDDQLDQWVREAIGELQAQLPPRTKGAILITASGQQTHALSDFSDMIALHGVEYPSGQTPQRMLARKRRSEPDFDGGPYYDLEALVPTSYLYIAEPTTLNEMIFLYYSYRYPLPEDDADLIIVPEEQHPIIHLYVHWKAALHESFAILTAATPDDAVGKELRLNAVRAEEMFWRRIEAMKSRHGSSGTVQWEMPGRRRPF